MNAEFAQDVYKTALIALEKGRIEATRTLKKVSVLQAPTVGLAPWSPALDENIGRAALYVPSDYGMPANGVLAESAELCPDRSRWLICDLDLAAVRRLREQGQVFTRRDWPRQFDAERLVLR